MSLSREQIVAAATAPDTKVIDVAEWGGAVRIRAMSYAQREDFTKQAEALRDSADPVIGLMQAMLRLVLVSVVNDQNERVFADTDEELLRSFNFAGYAKVRDAVQDLNGMRKVFGGPETADGPLKS